MHKFKVGDKVVVICFNLNCYKYYGCVGEILVCREYNEFIAYNVLFADNYDQYMSSNHLLPFTGFKDGDIVEVMAGNFQGDYGEITRYNISPNTKPLYLIKYIRTTFYEDELKYHHTHFKKETNMLDKEKLHKLVDGIDPQKYANLDNESNGTELLLMLEWMQKEKSLGERLREAGITISLGAKPKAGNIYVNLYSEECSVVKWGGVGRSSEKLNCPLDFDEIMATIKYLESRK